METDKEEKKLQILKKTAALEGLAGGIAFTIFVLVINLKSFSLMSLGIALVGATFVGLALYARRMNSG